MRARQKAWQCQGMLKAARRPSTACLGRARDSGKLLRSIIELGFTQATRPLLYRRTAAGFIVDDYVDDITITTTRSMHQRGVRRYQQGSHAR
jgi:hypothetical protein